MIAVAVGAGAGYLIGGQLPASEPPLVRTLVVAAGAGIGLVIGLTSALVWGSR